jgi:DNA-binding protein YbaB
MEPETWLAHFGARAEELSRTGEQAQQQLAARSASATSADGAVTVTVGPGGELRDLEIRDGARLARSIMQAASVAQRRAGVSAMGTFASLGYLPDPDLLG